jgi:hypothetical protein
MVQHPDPIAKTQSEEEHIENVGIEVQHADRMLSKWNSVKANPKTVFWIIWAIFVLCLQGFDNQAGGIVVGIEQFRKDFGYPYAGNYVLPANWQSAFSGGPTAAAVFGALFASWISDSRCSSQLQEYHGSDADIGYQSLAENGGFLFSYVTPSSGLLSSMLRRQMPPSLPGRW